MGEAARLSSYCLAMAAWSLDYGGTVWACGDAANGKRCTKASCWRRDDILAPFLRLQPCGPDRSDRRGAIFTCGTWPRRRNCTPGGHQGRLTAAFFVRRQRRSTPPAVTRPSTPACLCPEAPSGNSTDPQSGPAACRGLHAPASAQLRENGVGPSMPASVGGGGPSAVRRDFSPHGPRVYLHETGVVQKELQQRQVVLFAQMAAQKK